MQDTRQVLACFWPVPRLWFLSFTLGLFELLRRPLIPFLVQKALSALERRFGLSLGRLHLLQQHGMQPWA